MGVRSGNAAPPTPTADAVTLGAFTLLVIIGGSNFVLVRLSNRELAPFWGAGARFAAAALVMAAFVALLRLPLPRGRALLFTVLYGVLGFAGFYGFAYWGLLELPAGLGAVIFGCVPLLTLLAAVAHRLERLRLRAVIGALVAAGGITVMTTAPIGGEVRTLSVLAMIAGAVCYSEASVVAKRLPSAHPVTTNAVAMGVGAALLVGLSVLAGEVWALPTAAATWWALGVLVLLGSVGLFWLFLFTLGRWTVSALSYMFVLFPLVALVLGAWIADEPITLRALAGAVVVIVGVYVGALSSQHSTPPEPEPRGAAAAAE